MDNCVFCKIAKREVPAAIVYEDEAFLAFLDITPLFEGHCLLITKSHVETLADLPPDSVGPFFLAGQRLARAVETAMGAQGTFVALNNKVSQSVPHIHLHVVPRRKGDGLKGFFWPRSKYATAERMNEVAAQIAAAL